MSETVCVACKLPNGIMVGDRPIQGYAEEKRPGLPSAKMLWYGYAITLDFPADLWNEWLKRNADSDMVRGRFIFADEDPGYVMEICRQRQKVPQSMPGAVPGVSL